MTSPKPCPSSSTRSGCEEPHVCHFTPGLSLPSVLLMWPFQGSLETLYRDRAPGIHTKHTDMCSADAVPKRKRQAGSSSLEDLVQRFSISGVALILRDLSNGTPCIFGITLLHSLLSAWLMDSRVGTDCEKVGVSPFLGSMHHIFQWKMGKIKSEANKINAMKLAQSAFWIYF